MPQKAILVVDDHEFLRNFWVNKLSAADYKILTASDGSEGVKMAKKELPDLILLDIVMPKLNGYEALVNLKAAKKTKNIPVIILSNLGQNEEIKKGLKLGAVDFIVKSDVIPPQVEQKIKKYLNNN